MRILLISGKAEHGKTSAANILKNVLEENGKSALILNFASYLKYICEKYFNWNGKKDSYGRALLQSIGTDVVRASEPDFWVRSLWDLIRVFFKNTDYIIVDDVRFPNEILFFREMNIPHFSIRINRLDFTSSLTDSQKKHFSETALDCFGFDFSFNVKNNLKSLESTMIKFYKQVLKNTP